MPMSQNILLPQSSADPIEDLARNGLVEHLFPTPLFCHVFKNVGALNAELRELILEQERAAPSMVKSNQGGWQSPTDFFHWGGPAVATLKQYAIRAVEIATSRIIPQNVQS